MINNWLVTGDCHGNFERFHCYDKEIQKDSSTGVIILGDSGFNFWLDKRDSHLKNKITKNYDFNIYCVRGNHEARPQDISDMVHEFDINVGGYVWYQKRWPTIRYFDDYNIYTIWVEAIHKYLTLGVVGGAYSVDKFYRLEHGTPWFENEQLTREEMNDCLRQFDGKSLDIMLTHTCPISWEPRDLFLPQVSQSTVDKSMELFLEELKDKVNWKLWLWGHYHADRLERPRVEQFYKYTENLEDIWNRWYDIRTIGNEWYITKSPNYYMENE